VEKARSLLEAEANLDELDEALYEPRADEASSYSGLPHSGAAGSEGGAAHPSGFVAASVSQSGFSPIGTGRGESSRQHARDVSGVESGVLTGVSGQPSGDRLVDSLQGALGAASRNEAGLGSLQRAIRDASRAFTASRQAHEALTEELRVMHRGLNELMSEKAAVERYAALLTQERDAALDAAEEARREAKREREFLLREQDRFIQLLLEEHEAEVQQLRRSLSQRSAVSGEAGASGLVASPAATTVAVADVERDGALGADVAPTTVPGVAPAPGEQPVEGRKSSPPGEFLSGAALARLALAAADNLSPGHESMPRTVPLPGDRPVDGTLDMPRPEARAEGDRAEERAPTYPPAPTVLDLDSLAAEVDGNSERPPPIRRIGVAEPKIHLKPARVPTQLFDTLVSPIGELDPNRKS
jgi:hypothetical protein